MYNKYNIYVYSLFFFQNEITKWGTKNPKNILSLPLFKRRDAYVEKTYMCIFIMLHIHTKDVCVCMCVYGIKKTREKRKRKNVWCANAYVCIYVCIRVCVCVFSKNKNVCVCVWRRRIWKYMHRIERSQRECRKNNMTNIMCFFKCIIIYIYIYINYKYILHVIYIL